MAYLRLANRGAACHAGAILELLLKRLRQAWPDVRIVFRPDSGFVQTQNSVHHPGKGTTVHSNLEMSLKTGDRTG